MSAADAAIRRGPGARPQRDLPVPLLTHGVESSNQTCRIGRRCMTLKTLHDAPNNPTKAINVKRLDKTKPWRRISRRSNRPLNPTCAKQPSPVAKCRRPPRPAVGAPRIGRRHSIFQASARQERWQQAAHGRLYPIDLEGEKRVSARRNAQWAGRRAMVANVARRAAANSTFRPFWWLREPEFRASDGSWTTAARFKGESKETAGKQRNCARNARGKSETLP